VGVSAIDVERQPGDERGAREEHRRLRGVRHLADAPERVDPGEGVGILDERRPDDARRQSARVDALGAAA
jgi:hypothetical protein